MAEPTAAPTLPVDSFHSAATQKAVSAPPFLLPGKTGPEFNELRFQANPIAEAACSVLRVWVSVRDDPRQDD